MNAEVLNLKISLCKKSVRKKGDLCETTKKLILHKVVDNGLSIVYSHMVVGYLPIIMNGFSEIGLDFNPFEHLDSTQDAHLQDYLVIPENVDIAWSDSAVAIFALPGGGKSALRIYTENLYRQTRGVKFPVSYIPKSYAQDKSFHFDLLRQALARALFIYLLSYPDLYFVLKPAIQKEIKKIILYLPYELSHILSFIVPGQPLKILEELLDVNALSGITTFGNCHHNLAHAIQTLPINDDTSIPLERCFALIHECFGARSVHILMDGLDGFLETIESVNLLRWIEPLLELSSLWQDQKVYMKFFLPFTASDFPQVQSSRTLHTAALSWNDDLLVSLVRRRLYIASNGAMNSLDAISQPGVGDVELQLAHQLSEKQKLPRYMIKKTNQLMEIVSQRSDKLISSADIQGLEGQNGIL